MSKIDTSGTPKSLEEAIAFGLCVGPLKSIDERLFAQIKDFLAQRFCTVILQYPEHEDMLMELYQQIIQKRFKEPLRTIEEFKKKL